MTTDTRPWGVKGLTESPRAPIVAKAKIGEKGDRGQPKRLDYIIFVEPQTGRRLAEYQAAFGDKPTHFKALLSADRIRDMVDVAWKRYGKAGLKCRGDGERGIERETGEQRRCAGDFGSESHYTCPFANPQGTKPPECKPVLSMRLVVPQIPGLGVVQLDTGGVASSIPTLMWQLQRIEDATSAHMAGIAVEVGIRAFTDRFGNAAYSWQLTPLMAADAQELRQNIEGLVRIDGQVPKVLPALEEAPDADLYGLPAPGETYAEPEEAPQDEPENGIPGEWAVEVNAAESLYKAAAGKLPAAKGELCLRIMEENHQSAAAKAGWAGYVDWLEAQTDKMTQRTGQGTML